LEIILPKRAKIAEAETLLNEKRGWIEKNAYLLEKFAASTEALQLPQSIHLLCCNELWKISYRYSPGKTQIICRPQHELTVLGDIDDKPMCFKALRQWLEQKAEEILAPQLYSLSRQFQLPFKNLTVRNQKTRWGSGSSQKSINLNFKLIFLPEKLARHIMVHELCHTIHLNHSRKFWQLVAQLDPNWQIHRQMSRHTENYLPIWADG
jgi:predicted metal-dependent hydrolase